MALRDLGIAKSLAELLHLRFIFCPKCHCIYEVEKCIETENGQRRSKRCTWSDLGVTCDTALLSSKTNKQGQELLYAMPSQKLIYPGIVPQLKRILQRPVVQENLFHHLFRRVPPGVLGDIYEGTEWQKWKQKVKPGCAGETWFSVYGHADLGFVFNADAFGPYKRGQYAIYGFYMILVGLFPGSELITRFVFEFCTFGTCTNG